MVAKYVDDIGGLTTVTVTHSLGVTDPADIVVSLYDNLTGLQIFADVSPLNVNEVDISFDSAPGAGDVHIVVIG